jgi:hypothetical protein
MPTERFTDGAWLHPSRLPLGGGWSGYCCAPGHEGSVPSDQQLAELCNLGYAASCPRLPSARAADAVRFSVARESGSQILLWFVCEAGHRPAEYGKLEYDSGRRQWASAHPDSRIQKMAECFLEAYLLRRTQSADSVPSPHS